LPIHLATLAGADAHDEVAFGPTDAPIATLKVAPLRMKHRGTADRILARLARNPMQEVARTLDELPERERAILWERAEKASASWKRPAYGSYDASRILREDPDARWEMFRLILKANNPDVSDETLERIWEILPPGDFWMLWEMAVDASDPKALMAARRRRTPEEQRRIEEEIRRRASEPDSPPDAEVDALASGTWSDDEWRMLEEGSRLQDALAPLSAPLRWIGASTSGT
jgi:hypothetical protein